MKNIVLCGMMGSGKTTVARALNAIYNLNWVDTDDQIVGQYGAINGIFARLGEEGFRNIESAVTKRVAQSCQNSVISLGGGCVLRKINVEELKKTGVIFYLRTRPVRSCRATSKSACEPSRQTARLCTRVQRII